MAMTALDLARYNSLIERLQSVLPDLTLDELTAMEAVAKAFLDNRSVDSPFKPQTEDELFARIEQSIAQADRGELVAAEVVEAEMAAKYGIVP